MSSLRRRCVVTVAWGICVPKIVDHEHRRREVVNAALRVINRVGLENATMREIAREAKSSTGAIAHYFASKDDILRAALERADEDIRRRIEAMSDDIHPLTRLRAALREALAARSAPNVRAHARRQLLGQGAQPHVVAGAAAPRPQRVAGRAPRARHRGAGRRLARPSMPSRRADRHPRRVRRRPRAAGPRLPGVALEASGSPACSTLSSARSGPIPGTSSTCRRAPGRLADSVTASA